jgi:hypothetical protein
LSLSYLPLGLSTNSLMRMIANATATETIADRRAVFIITS